MFCPVSGDWIVCTYCCSFGKQIASDASAIANSLLRAERTERRRTFRLLSFALSLAKGSEGGDSTRAGACAYRVGESDAWWARQDLKIAKIVLKVTTTTTTTTTWRQDRRLAKLTQNTPSRPNPNSWPTKFCWAPDLRPQFTSIDLP